VIAVGYRIDFSPDAAGHLKSLTAAQRSLVQQAMNQQLLHEPKVPTRNRKRMRENSLSEWELRVRNLRVYYNVWDVDDPFVLVVAVGLKVRDRVFIAGKEADL
jgi:mRNA-degrading endonuclease RelE of RelBE toxin-antitoxin system